MSQLGHYTDHKLLLLVQQGEEEAFSILYDRYVETLIDFASSRLSSLEEARDIVHDLFVHLWQHRNDIIIKISLRAFLYAAIRYRIIDYYRKKQTQKKYEDQIMLLEPIATKSEDEIYVKELELKLHKAVEDLSPRLREIFRMSRYEYLNVAQIAKQLGISEQTVKNQLTTALSLLKAKLLWVLLVIWLYTENFFE